MPEINPELLKKRRKATTRVRPYDAPSPRLPESFPDAKSAPAESAPAKSASAKSASAKSASAKSASAESASAESASAILAAAKNADPQLQSFALGLKLAAELSLDACKMLRFIIAAQGRPILNKEFVLAGVNERKLFEAKNALKEKGIIEIEKTKQGKKEVIKYLLLNNWKI